MKHMNFEIHMWFWKFTGESYYVNYYVILCKLNHIM